MKKTLLNLSLVALVSTTAAYAAQANTQTADPAEQAPAPAVSAPDQINPQTAANNTANTATAPLWSTNNLYVKGGLGYIWNDNHFSDGDLRDHIGYNAAVGYNFSFTPLFTLGSELGYEYISAEHATGHVVTLSALPTLNLGQMHTYLNLGGYKTWRKADDSSDDSYHSSDIEPFAGIGASYDFTDNLAAFTEYDHYFSNDGDDNDDGNQMKLGVQYSF